MSFEVDALNKKKDDSHSPIVRERLRHVQIHRYGGVRVRVLVLHGAVHAVAQHGGPRRREPAPVLHTAHCSIFKSLIRILNPFG